MYINIPYGCIISTMNRTFMYINIHFMKENTLLLALIKDHIIHSRLLNGLAATGADVSAFTLHISNTIFQLAGLFEDEDESRYNYYLEMVERINHFPFDKWEEEAEPLTQEIYTEIVKWQEEDMRFALGEVEWE